MPSEFNSTEPSEFESHKLQAEDAKPAENSQSDDLTAFQFEPTSKQEFPTQELPRWRHGAALFLLLGFISFIAAVGFLRGEETSANPVLPADTKSLLSVTAFELLFFGLFWGAAWIFSRASADDLFLRWRGTRETILLGFAYSIGLRFVVAAAGLTVIAFAVALALLSGMKPDEITKYAQNFNPSPERMVNLKTIAEDPVYRFLMVTWVSFIVAGLREELWRVGVIAAWTKLLTPQFPARQAQIFAVVSSSLFFGFAHYIQGWIAVGMTAILGMCLGAITLRHRSIWPAVIAHGAFNALTFMLLPLASGLKAPTG